MTDSVSDAEAKKIILSSKERPGNQIKFLSYNTQMIPKIPYNPKFPAGYQDERMADLVDLYFKDYDIICLQEVWGLCTSELKDVMICYA